MRTTYFVICLLFSNSAASAVEPNHAFGATELVVVVNTPGTVPYLYFDNNKQQYTGVIADLLDSFAAKQGSTINYNDSNQLRSEQLIAEGKADLYLINPRWFVKAQIIIATNPIISSRTYLYSMKPFAPDFSLATLGDASICTRANYTYTGLQSLFSSGKLKRLDSGSLESMAAMLSKKRCDYAVLDNYQAVSIFYTTQYCQYTVFQSPQPTSEVDLLLVMRPDRLALKQALDLHIEEFKTNGLYQQSLSKHIPLQQFPKVASCKQGSSAGQD